MSIYKVKSKLPILISLYSIYIKPKYQKYFNVLRIHVFLRQITLERANRFWQIWLPGEGVSDLIGMFEALRGQGSRRSPLSRPGTGIPLNTPRKGTRQSFPLNPPALWARTYTPAVLLCMPCATAFKQEENENDTQDENEIISSDRRWFVRSRLDKNVQIHTERRCFTRRNILIVSPLDTATIISRIFSHGQEMIPKGSRCW